ncbi:hypothetical protein BG011_009821 [Mortierella polycephala]|uniref:CENP-T/Histone H4 histone fold domain-containing protein n=1 Tax=Mortierella polycephala TaxID=41804 RepID=A0A9P6TW85_9FUNG|nr:hypothetical protein BG011_009821 [Mortierella polycephala]
MEQTPTPGTKPHRAGLRRPNYGPMEKALKFPAMRRNIVDESLLQELNQTHIGDEPRASRQSNSFRDRTSIQPDVQPLNPRSPASSQYYIGGVAESRRRTADMENPFLVTKKPRTGLRRPNYGPMEEAILGREPATSNAKRIDEGDLLEILNPYRGHQRNSLIHEEAFKQPPQSDGLVIDNQPFRASTTGTGTYSAPLTPRRRTPRRKSASNFLKPSAIKAFADAEAARRDQLIYEAVTWRNRPPREQFSPMHILRQLSRVPGFNPLPKLSPERQPIPGSEDWRKLTPKSPRIRRISIPDEPNSTTTPRRNLNARPSSTGPDRSAMSEEERRAYDRFMNSNPFLSPEEINRLWEEEVDVARNRGQQQPLSGGRGSFGMSLTGNQEHALEDGDNTKDFGAGLGDLTDPFINPIDMEERPAHFDDNTITSMPGFEQHQEQEQDQSVSREQDTYDQGQQYQDRGHGQGQDQHYQDHDQGQVQDEHFHDQGRDLDQSQSQSQSQDQHYQDYDQSQDRDQHNQDHDHGLEQTQEHHEDQGQLDVEHELPHDESAAGQLMASTDSDSMATLSETPGITLALSMSQNEPSESANANAQDTNISEDADFANMNLDEEGWEDIIEDEEQGAHDQQQQQQQQQALELEAATIGNEEVAAMDHADLGVDAHMNADIDADVNKDMNVDMGEAMNESVDADVNADVDADVNMGMEMQTHEDQEEQDRRLEGQQEHEDGYMNIHEEDHVELHEHEEQQDRQTTQYFNDFPSELGIMSNGKILPTSFPAPKKTTRLSAAGLPVVSMPTSLQKQHIHTFSRLRVSQEAMQVVLEGSHQFFEQISNDLAAYADHAGRRTIDESDVECLMQRLRITNDKASLESLLHRYLPRELRDKVLYPDELQRMRRQ